MRIGLQVPSFTWPGAPERIGARLAEVAHAADDAGFYSLWVMDHLWQIRGVGQPGEPMLEGYSALNYLAGLTRNVRLGTLVTGVVYRHPGVLVKTVSTLDVLSGGRAYLGIGAAWNEAEARGLGIPFPALKERFERLEEALQIALQMWSGKVGPYEGQYYHLAETLNSPQPLQKPHPPILIGGGGEKKTLRLVAQYADACNLFARLPLDDLRRKLDVLKGYCQEIGRPYDAIERTALDTVNLSPGNMTAEQVLARLRELSGAGFQQVIFNMPNVHELTLLETFGRDIIPAARDL